MTVYRTPDGPIAQRSAPTLLALYGKRLGVELSPGRNVAEDVSVLLSAGSEADARPVLYRLLRVSVRDADQLTELAPLVVFCALGGFSEATRAGRAALLELLSSVMDARGPSRSECEALILIAMGRLLSAESVDLDEQSALSMLHLMSLAASSSAVVRPVLACVARDFLEHPSAVVREDAADFEFDHEKDESI